MPDSAGKISTAFPSAVWPVNRSESAANYVALDSLSLGVASCLLPVMPAPERGESPTTGLRWHPASVLPGKHSRGLLNEPQTPSILRPATRIPGFLKPSRDLAYENMVAQFRKAHSDVDIPHELIAEAFSEAAADTVWDERAPIKGNNVACCRPALDEEDLRAHCTDYEQAAMFLHKQEVKPLLQSVDGSEFGWSSRREWAIYAGGECNSELWALPLPSAEDAALRDCGFWPREPADMPIPTSDADVRLSLEFTTPIRQIISHDSHPGRACVRTDSMVTLVDLIQRHSGSSRIPHVDANIAGSPYTYDTGDRWTCHASWNARNASEIALASGTGCVRLWDYATSRDTLLRGADTDMQYDIQWNCCEYWSCPRQLLCANPDTLYMLDVRTNKTETTLMSLRKSPFASKNEVFTAICPSALHPMHAIAASTHAVRVFDQRYLKQPVLAWENSSLPFDPPVFLQTSRLPDGVRGRSACVFAATEHSSQIYGYVYGQDSSDQPYTSLDQLLLRPTTSAASVFETIQDPLAIDPYENQDFTTGHTYVAKYPTGRLAGVMFQFIASAHKSQEKRSDCPLLHNAVCVCLDELGAVTGHRIVVSSDSEASTDSTKSTEPTGGANVCNINRGIWTSACKIDGAVVDGMNLVFQTKADSDCKKEAFWTELRKRSEAYERVDMSAMYQHLADESSEPNSQSSLEMRQKLRTQLQSALDTRINNDDDGDEIMHEHGSVQPATPNIDLESKLSGLSSTAQLLDSMWAGNITDIDAQSQLYHPSASNGIDYNSQPSHSSRRKSRHTGDTDEHPAAWSSVGPTIPATAPSQSYTWDGPASVAAGIHTAPSSVMDMFSFASSQKPSSSTQPKSSQLKKKKARKSGF